jgi:serine protease AprX
MRTVVVATAFVLVLLPAEAASAGTAWTRVAVPADPALDPGIPRGDRPVSVIVQATEPQRLPAVRHAVLELGGTVTADLPFVHGVTATMPGRRAATLAARPDVRAVTRNRHVRFEELSYDEATTASSFARTSGATTAWGAGNLGQGVGVAVLDTGVSPMRDLAGRLVHGPDLSGEGSTIDSYGHGTVMAGIIGGSGVDSAGRSGGAYTGVAPKAHIVGVKVAGRNGVVDVSTILQAMHWVSAYRADLNIRVLNLSWGTTSTQSPTVDPLNYAVQRLWQEGIVVVVAAGNSGPNAGTIMKPGDDPMVLTVGAFDDKQNTNPSDDSLAAWSSRGPTAAGLAKPDVVAPGRYVISSRSYGSKIEVENPKALQSPSYIRGSGTSQAAAVTSGVAALLLAARPELTPDQVKAILRSTASPISDRPANDQGAGRIQLGAALTAPAPSATQAPTSSGLGSIERSRGGRNVETDCNGDGTLEVIVGEIDVRCEAWDGAKWTGAKWTSDAWTGAKWTGTIWDGAKWTGAKWTDAGWDGAKWTGGTWSGESWMSSTWKGLGWSDSAWSGAKWTGAKWTGAKWTAVDFTTGEWTTGEYDEFLTAMWGTATRGKTLPGERREQLGKQHSSAA